MEDEVAETQTSSSGLEENVAGALCYFFGWLTGLFFILTEKKSDFVKFHAWQSVITFGILTVLSFVPLLNFIIWFLSLFLWAFLMYKAYQGEKFMMPAVGEIAKKQSEKEL